MVDRELSVSEEIVESGRGIYSTFSANPTRGRDGGLAEVLSSGGPNGSDRPLQRSGEVIGRWKGGESEGCSNGVFGRLVLERGSASV